MANENKNIINREVIQVLQMAVRRAFFHEVNVCLIQDDWKDDRLHFGVNWGALGTKDPDKSIKFGMDLVSIGMFCKQLNEKEYKVSNDDRLWHHDYAELGEYFVRKIKNSEYNALIDWFRAEAQMNEAFLTDEG